MAKTITLGTDLFNQILSMKIFSNEPFIIFDDADTSDKNSLKLSTVYSVFRDLSHLRTTRGLLKKLAFERDFIVGGFIPKILKKRPIFQHKLAFKPVGFQSNGISILNTHKSLDKQNVLFFDPFCIEL